MELNISQPQQATARSEARSHALRVPRALTDSAEAEGYACAPAPPFFFARWIVSHTRDGVAGMSI